MHQSGTHWLKFMLASAMAEQHGFEPPRYNHANDIIGGLKDPRGPASIPDLRSTHSIPPLLGPLIMAASGWRFPPIVLLVRDLRVSLVSNYRKWASRYGVPFGEFVRGDPSGRRYNSDIWWCIRFLNAWGRIAAAPGTTCLVVHYEALQARPAETLAAVAEHLCVPLSPAAVASGVGSATKSAMLARADPGRPPGEINESGDDPFACYDDTAREFVTTRCAKYLHYPFGYDFSRWTESGPPPAQSSS